ncbi:hypothetical protein AQ914_04585 [Burkholderia pseudomallei]|nr:hypothetical protein AQ914_04585 [Burkholderia pseudomallei]
MSVHLAKLAQKKGSSSDNENSNSAALTENAAIATGTESAVQLAATQNASRLGQSASSSPYITTNDNSPASGGADSGNGAGSIAIGDGSKITDGLAGNADGAIAIGASATVTGNDADTAANAIALGANANVTQAQNAIAIGSGATVAPDTSGTNTTGKSGIAIGSSAKTNGDYGIAMGSSANATAQQAIAIGDTAAASGDYGVAVGASSIASGSSAIALGPNASASGADSIALGYQASATGTNSVALGSHSVATDDNVVSVGNGTTNDRIVNMAAGTADTDAVNVSQLKSVVSALGGNATLNSDGIVTGPTYTVGSTSYHSVGDALGAVSSAVTTNTSNIAANASNIGNLATALGGGASYDSGTGTWTDPSYKITSGSKAGTYNDVGSAVSALDSAVYDNTQTLDDLSTTGTDALVKQIDTTQAINVGADVGGTVVNFANNSGTARTLTGVADGSVSPTSTDAVNGSQLYKTQVAMANALGGGAYNAVTGTISKPTYTLTYPKQDGKDGTVTVHNVGNALHLLDHGESLNKEAIDGLGNQISSGSIGLVQSDTATGDLTVGQNTGGNVVSFSGTDGNRTLSGVASGTDDDDAATVADLKALAEKSGTTLGALSYDDDTMSTVTLGGLDGTLIDNVMDGNVAAGSMDAVNGGQLYSFEQNFNDQVTNLQQNVQNIEDGSTSTTVAASTSGTGVNSTITGTNANASGTNSTAIGANSVASADGSSAFGQGATASGANSTATGEAASATGANSTAIGANSSATGANSVALGQGAVADRDNSVSVGSAGNERQITNVAAGTQATDAVNLGQLNSAVGDMNNAIDDARDDAMGGAAAAMAVAGLPQATQPGATMVAFSGSTYGGQEGMAVGMSHVSRNDHWVVKFAGTTDTREGVGAVGGAGYQW